MVYKFFNVELLLREKVNDMEPLLAWIFWTLATFDPNYSLLEGLDRRAVEAKQVISLGQAEVDNQRVGFELQYSYYQPYAFGPLQPFYGISSTEKKGLMFGLGLGYEYKISDRFFLESSFLPGIYIKNQDTELGEQPFFRAKLGLGYRASKRLSASISYDHRSNGRINGVNPGMETLQVNFGFHY